MKLKIVELVPFSTFKEKLNIIKQFDKKAKIEIFEEYIIIERIEVIESHKARKGSIRKVGSR